MSSRITSVEGSTYLAERATRLVLTKENKPCSIDFVKHCLRPVIQYLNERYKQWASPDTDLLIAGTLSDVTRSKRSLIPRGTSPQAGK